MNLLISLQRILFSTVILWMIAVTLWIFLTEIRLNKRKK